MCDCGTTRLPATAPCTLRANDKGEKGVIGEPPAKTNDYNQNFRNKFCGCGGDYDAEEESSTMYQCLGLKGGCGEDWWHSTCVVGLDRSWYEQAMMDKIKEVMEEQSKKAEEAEETTGGTAAPAADAMSDAGTEEDPVPPGFPSDNDFEAFLCYKCVEANPWIKKYAGTTGFLEPVFVRSKAPSPEEQLIQYERKKKEAANAREKELKEANGVPGAYRANYLKTGVDFLDRQADQEINGVREESVQDLDKEEIDRIEDIRQDIWNATATKESNPEDMASESGDSDGQREYKRQMKVFHEELTRNKVFEREQEAKKGAEALPKKRKAADDELKEVVKKVKTGEVSVGPTGPCKAYTLPSPPAVPFSIFLKEDFRDHLCRCKDCFPLLAQNPCLLEVEDTYEPPVSEPSEAGSSAGSLFDRGEKALNSMDRAKAIEGVMAFNKLKEKLTPFFREFAESGKAISAEDIKEHFAKMRGDDSGKPKEDDDAAVGQDGRKEGEGY